MGSAKLAPSERRALTLRALRGESPSALAKEYGVARSWVYALVDEAKVNRSTAIEEAEDELEFRQLAAVILSKPKPRKEHH